MQAPVLSGGTWPQVGKISVSVLSLFAEEVCASNSSCHRAGKAQSETDQSRPQSTPPLLCLHKTTAEKLLEGWHSLQVIGESEPQLEPQSEPHFKFNDCQVQRISSSTNQVQRNEGD